MPEPITAVFAFLNVAIKFSEVALKLCEVGSENAVFVRLILRVRKDLEEVERLISTPAVKKKLVSTSGKLPYIKGVIFSTKSALNDIGRWVDRVRAEKEGYGSISFENRVKWVFRDHDKLTNRSLELSTNHQSLSNVLQYLMPLERHDEPPINNDREASPPNYHDATYLDKVMPMSSRQRRQVQYRKSQLDLRASAQGGLQEILRQTAQYPTHLPPILQTSFQEEKPSSNNGLASQNSKLRQAKSDISLALSYQKAPHTTPKASFCNPSTVSFLSQKWEDVPFTGTSNSPANVPRGPLSGHSAVSSLSTLNYRDIYVNPQPVTRHENLPENPTSPKHWSFSPERLSPRTPAIFIEEFQDSLRPQTSGTNSIGPVNPFEMFVEMENSSSIQKDTYDPAMVQLLEIQTQGQQPDVSEMMGNFSFAQQEKVESFAELPGANQTTNWNSDYGTYNPNPISKQEFQATYYELPSSGITRSTIELQAHIEVSNNGIETAHEPPSPNPPVSESGQQPILQFSAPTSQVQSGGQFVRDQIQHSQYPTNPQLHPQNHHPELPTPSVQHPQSPPIFYHQPPYQPSTQYQPYRPSTQTSPQASLRPLTAFPSPVSSYSYTPSSEPHRQTVEIPREFAEKGCNEQNDSLHRSETLSETRRRNQRVLLGLLR